MTNKIRTYTELQTIHGFYERFYYAQLKGMVGMDTFGFDRVFNQMFYKSSEWRRIRDYVINRDNGNDLGVEGCPISGRILVHHMNPIALSDIQESSEYLLNPEYLISVSHDTHNAIHYGRDCPHTYDAPIERMPGDTRLW